MDDAGFDHFARAIAGLTSQTSRRGLLGVAAALPVVGGGFALLDAADIEARKRDRKDRDGNANRDNVQEEKKKKKVTLCLNGQTIRVSKRKKKKFLRQGATPGQCVPPPSCVPDAKPTTCNGKCGSQINNCQQTVDCGSCDCNPPCGECFVCDSAQRTCVPKDAGADCGEGPRCSDGLERYQDTCDGNGACVPGGGELCGYYLCAGTVCGDSCADDDDCEPVAFCNGSGECQPRGNTGESCQADDECFSGQCCSNVCRECCDNNACTEPTAPVCFNNVCSPCTADPGNCPGDTCCNATTLQCVADCPGTQLCWPDNICAPPCESHEACAADQLCVSGVCHACTVLSFQNLQTAITNAEAGAKLYVCPGSYTGDFGQFEIDKSITIIGAGDGAGETALFGPVVLTNAGTQQEPVVLRDVRIVPSGFGISQIGGNLRMERCTVRGGAAQGVGVNNNGGVLEMRRCDVVDNTGPGFGAGVRNTGGSVVLRNCRIEGNTSQSGSGIMTGNGPNASSSSLELHNTEVRGNTANGQVNPTGAGVYNFNSETTVTISTDSVICDNDPVGTQCEGLLDDSRCSEFCPA